MEIFLLCFLPILCFIIFSSSLEYQRVRKKGCDSFTIFAIYLAIECFIPMLAILLILAFKGAAELDTGNAFFDKIYFYVTTRRLVIVGSFAIIFYLFTWLSYVAVMGILQSRVTGRKIKLAFSEFRIAAILLAAGIFGLIIVAQEAGSVGESYRWLVRFRNLDPEIDRTFLTANYFSLLQPLLFLASVGLLTCEDRPTTHLKIIFWGTAVLFFALASVSRKALIIPLVLFCSKTLLLGFRLRRAQICVFILVALTALLLGKSFFAFTIGTTKDVKLSSPDFYGQVLVLASDAGITVCESIGTIALFEAPMRLGIDHLLSIARRLPEEAIGFPDLFPERLVRKTTAEFSHPEAQDIPPGLMGMMWLDFRWLGPFIYGAVFGVGLALIERLRKRFTPSHASSCFFAVALFVYCLPINTGSLDFTFSMDIFFLVLLLVLTIKGNKASSVLKLSHD